MADVSLDLDAVHDLFESSTDFTIGLEEEFAIVDPSSLELEQRFEDLYAACQGDELLADAAAGELIASEIEIRSGRFETFAAAVQRQREHRVRLFGLAESMGLALAASSVGRTGRRRSQTAIARSIPRMPTWTCSEKELLRRAAYPRSDTTRR